jgi:hypothetical protein
MPSVAKFRILLAWLVLLPTVPMNPTGNGTETLCAEIGWALTAKKIISAENNPRSVVYDMLGAAL